MNPSGRTGTSGRGLLGKWGPNHAADPIVVREAPGHVHEPGRAAAYQMVVIKRADTGQWAIPGGMVDEGELVSQTLRREFAEEAAAVANPREKERIDAQLDELFADGGLLVYEGYVDDPRNTDHAWLETTVRAFFVERELAEKLPLASGSDANDVKWLDLDEHVLRTQRSGAATLYADHLLFITMALERVRAMRADQAKSNERTQGRSSALSATTDEQGSPPPTARATPRASARGAGGAQQERAAGLYA